MGYPDIQNNDLRIIWEALQDIKNCLCGNDIILDSDALPIQDENGIDIDDNP